MASEGRPVETKTEDEELDDWDQRIFSTGCADEQLRMNDCYYEKKDWRACKNEVSVEPQHAILFHPISVFSLTPAMPMLGDRVQSKQRNEADNFL
ncbi:hypothetical protein PV11_00171 [Exophiala sideris]|uniref:Uncharacterized protein n=1 Tax=Exophiala sideris TaxID=1016849 RepID=A0A0D1ZC95_9EURO|nr:hypothetical protein PV11_00171 [Exophiala sideris]